MASSGFTFDKLKNEYATLWNTITITNPGKVAEAANRIMGNKALYEDVMKKTGVPWLVVGIIHSLESNSDKNTPLHNGDPLTRRTKHKPSGRPPGTPPFQWVDSAIDALTMDHTNAATEWPVERIAFELERYNGFGYRMAPGRGNSA